MRSNLLNSFLPLLILTPLHFFSPNVSALALAHTLPQQQQQDSESGAVSQVKFSITSSSGTTSNHSLDLFPDSSLVGASLNGVVSFPKGTRIQKAWVTSSPSPRVRCEIGTDPSQPGEYMFYGGGVGTETAGEGAEGEAWEGDVEVKYVHCMIPSARSVIS